MLRVICHQNKEDKVKQNDMNCSAEAFPGLWYRCPSHSRDDQEPNQNNDHLRNSKLQPAFGEHRMQKHDRPKMYKLCSYEHVQQNRLLRPAIYPLQQTRRCKSEEEEGNGEARSVACGRTCPGFIPP